MASTADLIRTAVERFQAEVPALQNLKLIFGLELKGRGDIQLYRVEVPGPKISRTMTRMTMRCAGCSAPSPITKCPRVLVVRIAMAGASSFVVARLRDSDGEVRGSRHAV